MVMNEERGGKQRWKLNGEINLEAPLSFMRERVGGVANSFYYNFVTFDIIVDVDEIFGLLMLAMAIISQNKFTLITRLLSSRIFSKQTHKAALLWQCCAASSANEKFSHIKPHPNCLRCRCNKFLQLQSRLKREPK